MENYYSYDQVRNPSIVKVFGYMFLGLLISALSAVGLFYLFGSGVLGPISYFGVTIASSIGLIILVFVSQLYCLKNKKGGLITYGLYSLCMGVLLSSLMFTYSIRFLGFVFLCTSLVFGVMALYGIFTKTNTTSLGMFGVGALFGVITLTIINIFLQSAPIYYLISYISLAAMLALTAYDVNKAKQLANSGYMSEELAIYMALQLYTDFIYIFLRLVRIIGRSRN